MTKSTLDRIFTSRPVNKSAAMVTARGVHFETPAKQYGTTKWQKTPILANKMDKSAVGFLEDMTGGHVGRLRVIGYFGSGRKGSQWVVRCACGDYGVQNRKYLVSDTAKRRAMCPSCDYLEYLKYGDER